VSCFRTGYRAALSLGVWAVAAANPHAAVADQPTGLVQITCVPEVGYFSARLFQVFNVTQKPLKELRPLHSSIAGAHRIYTAIELEANPFECDLAGGDGKQVKIHALGHYDASSPAGGPRNIVNNVEITADRRSLGRLHIGFPWGPIDLMEVFYNGAETKVVTCSYYRHVEPEPSQGCTNQ
jgi:hypothetical protein